MFPFSFHTNFIVIYASGYTYHKLKNPSSNIDKEMFSYRITKLPSPERVKNTGKVDLSYFRYSKNKQIFCISLVAS